MCIIPAHFARHRRRSDDFAGLAGHGSRSHLVLSPGNFFKMFFFSFLIIWRVPFSATPDGSIAARIPACHLHLSREEILYVVSAKRRQFKL